MQCRHIHSATKLCPITKYKSVNIEKYRPTVFGFVDSRGIGRFSFFLSLTGTKSNSYKCSIEWSHKLIFSSISLHICNSLTCSWIINSEKSLCPIHRAPSQWIGSHERHCTRTCRVAFGIDKIRQRNLGQLYRHRCRQSVRRSFDEIVPRSSSPSTHAVLLVIFSNSRPNNWEWNLL